MLCLNRDAIIEHLTKVAYIRDTCNIAGQLSEDLFQHIWVVLLEMNHEKITNIHKKGYLQFYIYRMIVNEARNPNNPFLKMHKAKFEQLDMEFMDDNIKKEFDDNEKKALDLIGNQFWYDTKMFELYAELGSLRKVSAQTGIKYGAIHQTVNKVKKIVNENIDRRN